MDKFTKILLVVSTVGAIGAAGMNNVRKEDEVQLANDEQEYKIETEWAEDHWTRDQTEHLFCYGGMLEHLELEKSFLAWADATGRYIADVYYTGDHYEDPRLMVVRFEDTNTVVQVVLTASYKYRAEHTA